MVNENLTSVSSSSSLGSENSPSNKVAISIAGTFVGTVQGQRSLDGGVTWNNLSTGTAPLEATYDKVFGALYRVNVSAYTSGTIVAQIL